MKPELCQICQVNEATEQLPNESSLFVCYGCKVAQREVATEADMHQYD